MMNPIRNIEKAPGPGGPGGFDPERHRSHAYPAKRLAAGLRVGKMPKLKFQEGGDLYEGDAMVSDATDPASLREPDDQLSPRDQQMKQIVTEAMAALRGQHPDPQKAIQRFIDAFGEKDFEELKQMVEGAGPEPDDDDMGGPPDSGAPAGPPGGAPGGMQVGGLLHGPGGGQDDEIEAATPTGRKVLLSDGEYVIDAPTVAALGDGSTGAGARRLDRFREEVRRQAYGHEKQAKPMARGGRAMLEALNSE